MISSTFHPSGRNGILHRPRRFSKTDSFQKFAAYSGKSYGLAAKHDAVSRVVPMLDQGAGVVTTCADVHYVVTEYGVAYLHGKTLLQRAEALIAIAHPKFRDELYDFAVKAHYLESRAVLAA